LMTGTDILHVAYKSSTGARNDIVGGHVHMMFEVPIGSRPRACARVARTMPTRTDHVTLTRGAAALAAVANTLAVATSSPAMPQRDGRAALWPMSR
jgi:hypothetical protein